MPGDYDPGEASHRALRGIRRELERHPAVETARGFPADEHAQVVAELDSARLGTDSGEATLTVRWFAGETEDARPQFSFHYSETPGADFGWHHEPNPHVEEWGHFQQRSDSDSEYRYEPYEFSATAPTRVVWEVLSRLGERFDSG